MTTPTTRQDFVRTWWPVARDILAFFAGMAVIGYETLYTQVDRPWLLVIAIGMMGIPFAAKVDQWLTGGGGIQSNPPTHGTKKSQDEES